MPQSATISDASRSLNRKIKLVLLLVAFDLNHTESFGRFSNVFEIVIKPDSNTDAFSDERVYLRQSPAANPMCKCFA
jgi:hypothetical protein